MMNGVHARCTIKWNPAKSE